MNTACPCCGFLTLTGRARHEICRVCFWEDDDRPEADAHKVISGPNGQLSLTEARTNFATFGACEKRLVDVVRPPTPQEIPNPNKR